MSFPWIDHIHLFSPHFANWRHSSFRGETVLGMAHVNVSQSQMLKSSAIVSNQ